MVLGKSFPASVSLASVLLARLTREAGGLPGVAVARGCVRCHPPAEDPHPGRLTLIVRIVVKAVTPVDGKPVPSRSARWEPTRPCQSPTSHDITGSFGAESVTA